jgi:hypothetical protein
MSWVALIFAVFSMGFFVGSWFTGNSYQRKEEHRNAMREAAWRKRTA